jgi:hypothetical protein
MTGLKHNPYVGSFHGVHLSFDSEAATNTKTNSYSQYNYKNEVMIESKNNPLIGIFRHSPSSDNHKLQGLKGIIYDKKVEKPNIISQVQVH